MAGNSGRRFNGWSTVNKHEFFRFSETEQMYKNISYFKDTILFEYSYMDRKFYLSPNAQGQIDLQTFEEILLKHRDKAPQEGEIRSLEFCLGKMGEPYYWCSCKLMALWQQGTSGPIKLIGKLQDISGLKAREEQLLLQTLKDGLTGLYNKMAFEYRVEEKLKGGGWGWLCMIDIDNFKEINDCFGHLAGDRILMQVGGILCDVYPEPDLVGRVGGDEFVVFTTDKNVQERAEKLLNMVENIIPKEKGHLSVSIGIVPSAGKSGENYQKLFSKADRAMYQAKQAGKKRIALLNDV